MSVYRMNTHQLMKFVELYKDSECLWNYQIPSYKDREARDLAYNHIAEEMKIIGFGPKEVAQKIKNIRTTYKQELNKIWKSEIVCSPSDEIYKPKLAWFEFIDTFLRNIMTGPHTVFISEKEQEKSDYKYIKKDDETSIKSLKRTNNEKDKPKPSKFKFDFTPFKIDPVDVRSLVSLKKPEIIHPISGSSRSNETEFDIWAKSIAMQLNSMEIRRALTLQLQIQSLITNERLAYENSKADYYPAPSPPQISRFRSQNINNKDNIQQINNALSTSDDSTSSSS